MLLLRAAVSSTMAPETRHLPTSARAALQHGPGATCQKMRGALPSGWRRCYQLSVVDELAPSCCMQIFLATHRWYHLQAVRSLLLASLRILVPLHRQGSREHGSSCLQPPALGCFNVPTVDAMLFRSLRQVSHCRRGRAPEALAGQAVNGVPSGNGAVPTLDWSTVPPVPPSPLLAQEEGDRTAHKRELHTVNVGARAWPSLRLKCAASRCGSAAKLRLRLSSCA